MASAKLREKWANQIHIVPPLSAFARAELAIQAEPRLKLKHGIDKQAPAFGAVQQEIQQKGGGFVEEGLLEFVSHGRFDSRVFLITPELAAEILERYNVGNRTIRRSHVEYFINEMKQGTFVVTHQAIGFAPDKTLIDGQHRLMAIRESGVACKVLVAAGVSKETQKVLDCGIKRNEADRLRFGFGISIHRLMVATIRIMLGRGDATKTYTLDSLASFYKRHCASIVFAHSVLGDKCHKAPIRAVFARASYHTSQDVIRRFAAVMNLDVEDVASSEQAAIKFRKFLDRLPSSSGSGMSYTVHQVGQRAMRDFIEGVVPVKSLHAKGILFPLPEETVAEDDE